MLDTVCKVTVCLSVFNKELLDQMFETNTKTNKEDTKVRVYSTTQIICALCSASYSGYQMFYCSVPRTLVTLQKKTRLHKSSVTQICLK